MTPTPKRIPAPLFRRFASIGLVICAAYGLGGCASSDNGAAGAAGSGGNGTAGTRGSAGSGGAGLAGLGGSGVVGTGGSVASTSGATAGTGGGPGGTTGTGGGTTGTGGSTTGQGGSGAGGTGAAGTNGNAGTGGGTAGHPGSGGAGGHAGTSGAAGSSAGAGAGGGGQAGATGGVGGSAGVAGGGGQTSCPGESYDAASPPTTLTLSGNLGAHDPAAYVLGSTIYLAATGLIGKTSTNLTTWNATPTPLALPAWAATATGATNLWAPDISYFGGVYHLYYAASTFGSNKSCIGQATRAALDSGSWADQGMVLCSNMGETDDWNAIDPNVVVDDAGTPWLEFGSFWSGLKLVKLTSTGARADTTLYSLANGANSRGSLEGGWIFKRCGYYYLFSSWGSCCSSPYDYNIRVGRSTTVTGPYVDEAGTSLMSGGGTLLVQGNSSWVAPGHNAVIIYNGKTYNMYHALQGSSSGAATLRIAEIAWDANGWPVSGGP
jgi:arabinan endo-1,5-alpha-L-arabinosidase